MTMDNAWFVASYVALWLFVTVSLVLWVALLRQIGVLHARWGPRGALVAEEGPSVGSSLPRLIFPAVGDGEVEFPQREGLTLAVVFSPGCSMCDEVAPAVGTLMRDPPEAVTTIALIVDAEVGQAREFASRHGLKGEQVAAAPPAREALGIVSTPMALIADSEGRLLSKGIANSLEHLEVLVATARSEREDLAVHLAHQASGDGQAKHHGHVRAEGGEA